MTKAAVVHFDGDCVIINFWLLMYSKFWRGEVDKIYCNTYFDTETEPILRELFGNYPEIKVNFLSEKQTPELTNNQLIPKVKEDLIFLTEEDNFIFEKGVVKHSFNFLKFNDIVAPDYAILPQDVWEKYGRGWMRSMFFIKKALLKKIEIDFMPRHVDEGDLDCFGYVCLQLAKLKPEVVTAPNHNLIPSNPYDANKYVHVRQFNSSNLGFGTHYFEEFRTKDFPKMDGVYNTLVNNPEGIWQWTKSVAFRKLFLESFPDGEYKEMYREVLKAVEEYLELPRENMLRLQYYWKGVFRV